MFVKHHFFARISDEFIAAIAQPINRPGVVNTETRYASADGRIMQFSQWQPGPFTEEISELAMPDPYELPHD